LEFEHPIPTALPVEAQIALAYRWGYLAECNEMAARMIGRNSPGELLGLRLDPLLPREGNESFLVDFAQSGYRLAGAESNHVDTHGNPRCFLQSLTGFVQNGLLLRVWGTQQDISGKKLVERSLREIEERQRLAVDAGRIGLWDWDLSENRVIWSERMYEFHGLQAGEFDGAPESFLRQVHASDRSQVTASMGTTRDFTESREAEQTLRQTNAELEEFAYAASHDLQEPLRTISIYTGLLIDCCAPRDEQAQQFAAFIQQAASRMETLIRDLLSYSRVIHEDKQEPHIAGSCSGCVTHRD
jgi:signal transduction histidine kinase